MRVCAERDVHVYMYMYMDRDIRIDRFLRGSQLELERALWEGEEQRDQRCLSVPLCPLCVCLCVCVCMYVCVCV